MGLPMLLVVAITIAFAIALIALWLILFPTSRDAIASTMRHTLGQTGRIAKHVHLRTQLQLGQNASSARHAGTRVALWFGTYQLPIVGGLITVLLPVTVLLLFGHDRRLEGFNDTAHHENAVVSSLLIGEQLVPPPPLPPEIFITREVTLVRPNLGGADRDWNRLDMQFRQKLLQIFQTMAAMGYPMVLLEGYRSPERQTFLQNQGSNVTNAGAFQSYHQFGLAADCAFFRDGKLVISEQDPWALRAYQRYGELAQAAGLSWGGKWTLRDFGHIEQHRQGLNNAPHR
jgi:peptidoglycan LD-endopeptidase CwlK